MDRLYEKAMNSFKIIAGGGFSSTLANEEKKIIDVFTEMGHVMKNICTDVPSLKVYSFETERQSHAEASRVIAKLRDMIRFKSVEQLAAQLGQDRNAALAALEKTGL